MSSMRGSRVAVGGWNILRYVCFENKKVGNKNSHISGTQELDM